MYYKMPDANFLRNAPEMIEDYKSIIATILGEKKRCVWLKKGHSGRCGKKFKDGPFCDEHLQKFAAGRSLRFPCIVCLAGIKDSAVCASCSLEQEVIEFEKDDAAVGTYWWHYKKQQSGK